MSMSMSMAYRSLRPRSLLTKARPLAVLSFAAALFIPTIASAQVALGTAENFGVLAGTSISNTGPTGVTGDSGVSPGASITGFPPGFVVGATHAADATAAQAQTDLGTAYGIAAGMACNTDLTGQDLGGMTLTPGVYCFATSAQLTGTLTLNYQNNPNAVFVFQIGSTLTTASASTVVATNTGGNTCRSNVNWQVGSSATLGTNTSFVGNILALTSTTLNTGASLLGRALARNGAVLMDTNTITICSVPPPVAATPTPVPTLSEWGLILLSSLMAMGAFAFLRRRNGGVA